MSTVICRVLKTITHPDGKRRVNIVERENGRFSYELETFSDEPSEKCWISDMFRRSFPVCDSPEKAESEARERVQWIVEMA